MTMRQAVRVRCLVIRLRRRPQWAAQRLADRLEARLLAEMNWTK